MRLRPGWPGAGRAAIRAIFAVVVDVAHDTYLVSVYLFADGTITIHSSAGTHSTGLRGAPSVVEGAAAIFEEVEAKLAEFDARE